MERNGDFDNAHVFTDSAGFYIRFTDKGTYTLTFSHPNYRTKAITGFRVEDWERKYPLNVELCPINVAVSTTPETKIQVITCIPYQKGIRFSFNGNTTALLKADIYSINGIKVRTVPFKSNNAVWDGRDEAGNTAANGCYIVKIAGGNQRYVTNFIVKN